MNRMKPILRNLIDIDVGYLSLNRGVGTLSSGEFPRVKMAKQLGCDLTGLTYIFDEPIIGLHMADIERLLDVVSRLVDGGNTVIKHSLDDIKHADWVIDI